MKKKMAPVEMEPYLFNYVNFEAMSSLFGKRLKADIKKIYTWDQIGTKYHYYLPETTIMNKVRIMDYVKVISPNIKNITRTGQH